jgi:translation initiation factor IF-3
MAKDLEDNAEIQQPPKREGRNMIMFLSPRKAAAPKGNSKAASSSSAEPAG